MEIETQRSALEELEQIEQAIADRISHNPEILPDGMPLSSNSALHGKRKRPLRETLASRHEVGLLMDRYQKQCRLLKSDTVQVGAWDEFDQKIAQNKEYHRRYPAQIEDQAALFKRHGLVSSFASDLNIDQEFSGEEYFGKFFDLAPFHERFVNLKVGSRISFLQYLNRFTNFDDTELYPPARLREEDYQSYILDLQKYFEQFLYKTQPLSHPERTIAGIKSNYTAPQTPKSEGLYCGVCAKEFSNENVFKGHLNGKKHKKNAAASSDDSPVLLAEYCVKALTEFMSKTLNQTRNNLERRQALTDRERQKENEMLELETYGNESGDESELEQPEEEEEDLKYNPLKLPLGPDGNPIPYWQYKQFGLDKEFDCEICGNYSYKGHRAFEKHFNEARHQTGLRCLNIEPSALYKFITSIQDALELSRDQKKRKKRQDKVQEDIEEIEDETGEAMPKRVFEMLEAQGVL